LDSGQGITHTVPIFEGYAIPHAITPIPICGMDLTKYMLQLMQLKDPSIGNAALDFISAEDAKIRHCEVAIDFDAQLKEAREKTADNDKYTLPGGQKISIKEERLMCPELLFQPRENNADSKGIHNYTFDSIMKCENDIKKELFRNIVMAGGSTMFKNMQKRMKKEI
jgi:actin beta/gamma 1